MVKLMANCFKWLKGRNKPFRDIKLVIIGLDDAGKSTTVASLQGEPPDGITPTIGFCNASLTFGKWNVTLYDLGGGTNVRTVWEKYYAEIYGIVFAVDSSNVSRLSEAKDVLINTFKDSRIEGKPVIVFANKQDKDGALNEADVIQHLDIEELSLIHNFQYKVFPCSAIKGYGKQIDACIKMGIEWLLECINQDFDSIQTKVDRESSIQKEKETKERKERLERIRKLREERENAAKEAGVEESESESDNDVMTDNNPFRNIDDQITVTEKREKKEKAKMKKIKEYQLKNQIEKHDNDTEETNTKSTKKVKKKKKKGNTVIGETSQLTTTPQLTRMVSREELPTSSDETKKSSPRKKRKVKKVKLKKVISSSNEDIDVHNAVESAGSHTLIYVNSAENLRNSIRKSKKQKASSEDNNQPIENSVRRTARQLPKLKDHENYKKQPTDNTESCKDEGYDDSTSQNAVNDSRAELFRAKSNDNLRSDNTLNKCKMNNDTARKKKKKKKKKNKNKTLPSCSNDDDADVDSSVNSHVSKLQPIKLTGRLPDLHSQYSNVPAWARAKPNCEDYDVVT